MKPFTLALLATALTLTPMVAVAQSDPHHPETASGAAPTTTEAGGPAPSPQAAPEMPAPDPACPKTPPMMMEMMAGGGAMPMMQMMQMMQMTQLEMMQNMTLMQQQMMTMQRRLDDLAPPMEDSP